MDDRTIHIILHNEAGLEITLFESLFRVGIYLLAFGSIASVVFWGIDVARSIHSEVVNTWGDEQNTSHPAASPVSETVQESASASRMSFW
ncbi:hypothetical protein [Haloarcula amylovorans]|uniref:hypothetical protein n=1 Tax=Haloarcula amylovorans TaxID=2562280 RepID=UPI001431D0A5|nr:hypothetical protein [Halomicroarcula amylolytica]